MATNYNIDKTKNGVNGFGLPFCNTIYSVTLSSNTDTSVAVPLTAAIGTQTADNYNKFYAVFSYTSGANVYVALNQAAAVPAGNTFASSVSVLNPVCKQVKSTDVIHIISTGTPSVTVEFFAIQE